MNEETIQYHNILRTKRRGSHKWAPALEREIQAFCKNEKGD